MTEVNRMQSPAKRLLDAPRCGAKGKRKGTPCQAPAIRGKARCRMHGGKSPGAPKGNTNNLRHGRFTAQAMAERRARSKLLRELTRTIRALRGS